MNKLMEAIKKDRLYILLLIFVVILTFTMMLPGGTKAKKVDARKAAIEMTAKPGDDLALRRAETEKILQKNAPLAMIIGILSLLVIVVIFLGLVIDLMLISFRLRGGRLNIASYHFGEIKWNVWDVAKVVILFLFFGYMTIIIEALLCRIFPILKNDNFRMIFNTSMLDILTIVFILYFIPGRYKERLVSLGVSIKNFFKNVFYGIIGYLAMIPVLVAIIIATTVVITLTKYVPEKQVVVELFLKEKDVRFLLYTTLFAAIVGPMIEELFFRGFMYNAFKKYIGIFWATMITAAAFAALHAHIVGFLPIMVLGILLAYLYEKTGTLVSSITVHIMHNLSMVMFVFLAKQLKG